MLIQMNFLLQVWQNFALTSFSEFWWSRETLVIGDVAWHPKLFSSSPGGICLQFASKIQSFVSGYNAPTLFEIYKRDSVQGACHSPNTLPNTHYGLWSGCPYHNLTAPPHPLSRGLHLSRDVLRSFVGLSPGNIHQYPVNPKWPPSRGKILR